MTIFLKRHTHIHTHTYTYTCTYTYTHIHIRVDFNCSLFFSWCFGVCSFSHRHFCSHLSSFFSSFSLPVLDYLITITHISVLILLFPNRWTSWMYLESQIRMITPRFLMVILPLLPRDREREKERLYVRMYVYMCVCMCVSHIYMLMYVNVCVSIVLSSCFTS